MATYARASQARELISRAASLNNTVIRYLEDAVGLKSKLDSLDATARQEVQDAVTDMGYSPSEIYDILTKLGGLKSDSDTRGIAPVESP